MTVRVVHVDPVVDERGDHLTCLVETLEGELAVVAGRVLDLAVQRQQVEAVPLEDLGPPLVDVFHEVVETRRGRQAELGGDAGRGVFASELHLGDRGDHRLELGFGVRQPAGAPGPEEQALHLELVHQLLEELTHGPQLVGEIFDGIHPEDRPEMVPSRTELLARAHHLCTVRSDRPAVTLRGNPRMIRLTRLRQTDPFYVNPDHVERIEHHHDTHVHLFNGNEYVVSELPEEIVERVIAQKAQILAVAARLNDEFAEGAE